MLQFLRTIRDVLDVQVFHVGEAPAVLMIMVAIAVGMLAYFRGKGWLGGGDSDGE